MVNHKTARAFERLAILCIDNGVVPEETLVVLSQLEQLVGVSGVPGGATPT
jgi:hypothetical protein